jgi:integrase
MANRSAGIRVRHSRTCPANDGGGCRCKPSYEAAVQLRGPDPKKRRKLRRTFSTEGAARTWRVDQLNKQNKGTLREPTNRTVREAARDLIEGMRAGTILTRSGDPYKPSVIRSYDSNLRLHILDRFGGSKLLDVQRRDVQRLVDELQAEGRDPSTIRNAIMPLRVVYRRAIEDGDLEASPCEHLRMAAVRGKRDRIASPAEAEALLATLPAEDRALWATAFYAGLRHGEIRGLHVEDVDLANGKIHVRRSWDQHAGPVEPKSQAGRRTVPIPAVLRDYLDEHKMRLGRDFGLFFGRTADLPFNPTTIANRAARAWAAAAVGAFLTSGRSLPMELEPIGLHECRHTFASLMIAANVNIKAISTFMGHSSIQITLDRYGHLLPGSEDEAADLLDAYLERANTQARLVQVAARSL